MVRMVPEHLVEQVHGILQLQTRQIQVKYYITKFGIKSLNFVYSRFEEILMNT